MGRGFERPQACVAIELDAAEDIFGIKEPVRVAGALRVYGAVTVLVKTDILALTIGGDDVEAFCARPCKDGIDRTRAFEWITGPRNQLAARRHRAIIGEDMDIIDIEGEPVMDDDAALYATKEIRIKE